MMKTMLTLLTLAIPVLAAAQAQTVWRCGADGRSYSATPCAEGRALDTTAARPAADLQAARQVAERDRRLADGLRQERLQREALTQHHGLAGFYTARAPVKTAAAPPARGNPPPKAKPKQPATADTWQATAPASRRTKG